MNKQQLFDICKADIELYNKCLSSISEINEIDKCDTLLSSVQKCLYNKPDTNNTNTYIKIVPIKIK